MNITIIFGSPKQNGNTALLLKRVQSAFRTVDQNIHIDYVDLNHLKYYGCQDCRSCSKCLDKPGCLLQDDLFDVLNRLPESDLIILASPVFMCHVSGQLKLFIDRLFCMKKNEETPGILADKSLALVMTMTDGLSAIVEVDSSMKKVTAYLDMNYCGILAIPHASPKEIEKPENLRRIQEFSESLIQQVQERKEDHACNCKRNPF